ncbi:MAG: aspartate ammonia-lyase [Alphaproteobacteria bacterium]|nr:aspartate ammonia-lyase [Alphaproteobacteria bacterium]
MTDYRTETDLIGSISVPADALYGAQTQRAVELYPLNGEKPLSAYPELIQGVLAVKKIAAVTNKRTGELAPDLADAIIQTIAQLADNLPAAQFPVHACHGGGGISTNMNVNEVLANLANKVHFQQPLGSYTPIHPNDHINLNNATSDTLGTACHFAVIGKWRGLHEAACELSSALSHQAEQWQRVLKISRTCLQDAVEISFADLFSGYVSLIERNCERLNQDIEALYNINLGGNIIGRKGDCSAEFFALVLDTIHQVMGCDKYRHSPNLFDASQNHDDLVSVANRLDLFARGLLKIAKDFRLMSSGPSTGFGELHLPAVQPGSSAMPGKINPTIPEYLVQCCMQACGRCYAAQMTQDHGELDLNVWQTVVVHNVLDAINALENGIRSFMEHCVKGIEPDIERNHANINTLIPALMRLKQQKGYSYASRIYKESGGDLAQVLRYLADSNGSE